MTATTAKPIQATTLAPALALLETLLGNGGLDERAMPRTSVALARHLQTLGLTKRTAKDHDAPPYWGATHAGRDFLHLAAQVGTW